MTSCTPKPIAKELWDVINGEITGIQLLWEAVDCLYFKSPDKGFATLETDTPLLFGLTQTAMMESLLMRIARLMDPAISGKGQGSRPNLSLSQLVSLCPALAPQERSVRKLWDDSSLKRIRDKYLSHNDLAEIQKAGHKLSIPLQTEDIEALRALASDLRALRRSAPHQLNNGAYLDESLDLQIQREIGTLGNLLQGG